MMIASVLLIALRFLFSLTSGLMVVEMIRKFIYLNELSMEKGFVLVVYLSVRVFGVLG